MTGTRIRPSDGATITTRTIPAWRVTTARVATSVVGVTMLVMGAVALARTGIPADLDLTAGHVNVGWLHHTPLLAIVHLVIGATLIPAGWYLWLDERATSVGMIGIVAGLVFWIEPDAFHNALGIHTAHGVTYVAVGATLVLVGWLTAPRWNT